MLITVIFLISCVISARLLEKKKMRVASIAYSVLFIVFFAALLLTSDVEAINRTLSAIMGAQTYQLTRNALFYAYHSAGYGTCILIALFFTLMLQLALPIICAVARIVKLFGRGKVALISKKDKYRRSCRPRALYLQRHINLLYCRMLN